jgi:maleamate amidohydrolase
MTDSTTPWDDFLTEQDKAYVDKIGPLPVKPFGLRPALLMIDHCNYATGRSPQPLLEAMDENPMSCGLQAWEAVAQTRKLLDACRGAGITVIYTAPFGVEPGSPRRPLGGGLADKVGDNAWAREIISQIAPLDEEMVFRKFGASSFAGTPLDAVLRRDGVDTLFLTGNTTSGCVRATAIDAAYLQFKPFVVEECVYDRTQAAHAMSLFDMHYKYAQVVVLDRILAYLDDRSSAVASGP